MFSDSGNTACGRDRGRSTVTVERINRKPHPPATHPALKSVTDPSFFLPAKLIPFKDMRVSTRRTPAIIAALLIIVVALLTACSTPSSPTPAALVPTATFAGITASPTPAANAPTVSAPANATATVPGVAPPVASPAAPSPTGAAFDAEALYARVSPAVVTITNRQKQGRATIPTAANAGSGLIIDARGNIVTNRHVIDGAELIEVTLLGGQTVAATLVGQDPVADIAVVRIDAKAIPGVATFGDSAQMRPGQRVVAIGSPKLFETTITHGIISGTDRVIGSLEGMLQTDAAISPGNSGGPLVNANGEVIGINTIVLRGNEKAEKLGFAVPSNLAKRLAATLIADGKVTRPYLGVFSELLSPARAEELGAKTPRGAYISDVTAGTPATQAGLRKGDVIVRFGTTVVDRPSPLSVILLDFKPGQTVTLTINRGGTEQSVTVALIERPAALDP